MTKKAVNVADIPEEDGKTPRQKNMEMVHNIPVGTFVELKMGVGLRLYVAKQVRDCDGTPLYALSHDPEAGKDMDKFDEKLKEYSEAGDEFNYQLVRDVVNMKKGALDGNYSEDVLEILCYPEEQPNSLFEDDEED